MALPKTYTGRGFTLIELLVVMSLLIIVGGFSLIVSMDSFRGYTFRATRDLYVSTLERARAQAIDNICLGASCTGGKQHGVYINTDASGAVTQLIIYQGASYATADHSLDNAVMVTSVTRAVMVVGTRDYSFSQLAATSTGGVTRLYTGLAASAIATSTITVGSEGQIAWTN